MSTLRFGFDESEDDFDPIDLADLDDDVGLFGEDDFDLSSPTDFDEYIMNEDDSVN